MRVILLENYKKLGKVGNVVNVRNGFARNYLLPNKMALQATAANLKVFDARKEIILQEFENKKAEADAIKAAIEGKYLHVIKQAGVDDRLYGSVTQNDIVKAIEQQLGKTLGKNRVILSEPIKYLGCHSMTINIFADAAARLNVVVARTEEEAHQLEQTVAASAAGNLSS
jgi:large subunit ribosomal protein L9